MPEFTNPFPGMTPDRKMTLGELVRALRLDVAAELEAIHLYEAHADAVDHPLAKKVLRDVANEERVHVGEFQQLINILLEDETAWLAIGAGEVNEMAEEVARGDYEPASAQEKAEEEGNSLNGGGEENNGDSRQPTIGSLKQF